MMGGGGFRRDVATSTRDEMLHPSERLMRMGEHGGYGYKRERLRLTQFGPALIPPPPRRRRSKIWIESFPMERLAPLRSFSEVLPGPLSGVCLTWLKSCVRSSDSE